MKKQHVQFCDGCGKVRDDLGAEKQHPRWVELRAFQMTYGFQPDDLLLAHTYCPGCQECVQAGTQSSDPGRASR
ncbi:hypothetical protein YTPLAS18_36010 [Nitrospira sp.]|nr:hypothetical protein YTPLAS18_36010 [Nitrospira sp.]